MLWLWYVMPIKAEVYLDPFARGWSVGSTLFLSLFLYYMLFIHAYIRVIFLMNLLLMLFVLDGDRLMFVRA